MAYANVLDPSEGWRVLDWFMAVGAVVALVTQYTRKRAEESGRSDAGVSREYLAANFAFYASVLLAIWFLWNWIDSLVIGVGNQNDTNVILWAFIDPLFIMVMGITGCYLWTRAKE